MDSKDGDTAAPGTSNGGIGSERSLSCTPTSRFLGVVALLLSITVVSKISIVRIMFFRELRAHGAQEQSLDLIIQELPMPTRIACFSSGWIGWPILVLVLSAVVWHYARPEKLLRTAVLFVVTLGSFFVGWLILFGFLYRQFIYIGPLGDKNSEFDIISFFAILSGFFPTGLLIIGLGLTALVRTFSSTQSSVKLSCAGSVPKKRADSQSE